MTGILVVAFLVYDRCSYYLPAGLGKGFVLAHGAVLLLFALVNVRWALPLLMISIIFADDISRLDPYGGYAGLTNLMTVPVAGVAAGNLVFICIIGMGFFFALMRWTDDPKPIRLSSIDKCILAIGTIYLVSCLHGFRWIWTNYRGAINDLNLPIMLCGLYFLVRMYVCKKEDLVRLWTWCMVAMVAKAVIWSVWFFLHIGFEFGTTIRVSSESGRILLVLILAYGLVLMETKMALRPRERAVAVLVVVVAAFNLLVNASRMHWLFAAYALSVLVIVGRLADKVRWIVIGAVCSLAVVLILLHFNPDAFKTVGHFAGTLKFWEGGQMSKSHSTMVRVYEFWNIHEQLLDHRNLLFGEGPGSHFTDRYHPFPFGLTEGDYPIGQIEARRFQNPHGLLQTLMLNLGYAGMGIYLLSMCVIYINCFTTVRRAKGPLVRAIALTLLAFLPAMVYSAWSAKTNMLLGILLGVIGCLEVITNAEHERGEPHSEPQAICIDGDIEPTAE